MRKFKYFLRGRLLPCALLFALIVVGWVLLALWLPRLLAPVAILERIFSLAVALYVVQSEELPEVKRSKLVLLFVPWTGAILCLVFRTPKTAFLRANRGHAPLLSRHTAKSVEYFSVGREMYERLLCDLKEAKHHIFLEYYIIARGKFWGDISELLVERAASGVDVRVIYDAFGCGCTLPDGYERELSSKGIRAAVYKPLRVGKGFSRRDHRKLAVIDCVAYLGGVNLSDEYIGETVRLGHWKDTAIRIEGGVEAFSEQFLRTWYALRPSDGFPKVPASEGGDLPFYPLFDGDAARDFPHVLLLLIARAEERLYLFTPYLSLPDALIEALAAAAEAGTDVRIMIPHIPDKKSVFFLTRAYARLLAGRGIAVREYTPGFLHAKSAVADGKIAAVSSYNLDFRSFYVQAECGALVEDERLAAEIERDFLSAWEQGAPVKKTNAFLRLLGRIAMLFAPLT